MDKLSIKDIQIQVDSLIRDLGGYWSPLGMLASITEEVGELAREINALEGFKLKKTTAPIINIGEELADLLFSIICISNYYKIDISSEIEQTLKKYRIRDKNRFKREKIDKTKY